MSLLRALARAENNMAFHHDVKKVVEYWRKTILPESWFVNIERKIYENAELMERGVTYTIKVYDKEGIVQAVKHFEYTEQVLKTKSITDILNEMEYWLEEDVVGDTIVSQEDWGDEEDTGEENV